MTDVTPTVRRRAQLRGPAARALSPTDLGIVSALLDRDPSTWTVEEARTVLAVRGRAGDAARRVLAELCRHADEVIERHERPYRPLLDEYRAIAEELGRVSHHDTFGRHLARDRVNRVIRETEQRLRDEVRARFEPVFATALNPEHSNRIAAQMRAELAQVEVSLGQMRLDAPRMVEAEARRISLERQQERERRDRDLSLRRQEIEGMLRSVGVQVPAAAGAAA